MVPIASRCQTRTGLREFFDVGADFVGELAGSQFRGALELVGDQPRRDGLLDGIADGAAASLQPWDSTIMRPEWVMTEILTLI